MVYVCEFEFWESPDHNIIAEPLSFEAEGTFGSDMTDAIESAADWLIGMVDDHLIRSDDMPPMSFGHTPQHKGKVIAVAVSRELGDIPAMTAADAARELGITRARVTQLCNAGLLESWHEGTKRMVTRDSIEARKEYADAIARSHEQVSHGRT